MNLKKYNNENFVARFDIGFSVDGVDTNLEWILKFQHKSSRKKFGQNELKKNNNFTTEYR